MTDADRIRELEAANMVLEHRVALYEEDLDRAWAAGKKLAEALRKTPCRFVALGDHNDCAHAGGGRGAQDPWCDRCSALADFEAAKGEVNEQTEPGLTTNQWREAFRRLAIIEAYNRTMNKPQGSEWCEETDKYDPEVDARAILDDERVRQANDIPGRWEKVLLKAIFRHSACPSCGRPFGEHLDMDIGLCPGEEQK
jgi:hypothetical protein